MSANSMQGEAISGRQGNPVKSAFRKFERKIGEGVQSVVINVLFFGVERQGKPSDVVIVFEDGVKFDFGCAGDGSVRVNFLKNEISDPPNFVSMGRRLRQLEGRLEKVLREESRILLKIGAEVLTLTNCDDQLDILLNGKLLGGQIYLR